VQESFSYKGKFMEYKAAKLVSLKNHPTLNEKWLQERIIEDPSILGLGNLDVRESERIQPTGGRLDLLMSDPESLTRYEVEIQLGASDEKHIVRTLEYWDIERRRYPQYDHVAVLVAEDVTSRFLNVISLFNGFIPIIAIQMQALEVGGNLTLTSSRVLDVVNLGTEEEDTAGAATDRSYWESKATPSSLKLADRFIELAREKDSTLAPKYNKYYIGLARNGIADNFISLKPKKNWIIFQPKIASNQNLNKKLDDAGLQVLAYERRFNHYKIRISESELLEHMELIREIIEMAYEPEVD
jgi:hypothetical protein